MASVLRQSWRSTPPVFSGTDSDLDVAVPILTATGAASLAWWRLRQSFRSATRFDEDLKDAFRTHSLQAALHERAIRTVLAELSASGVDSLLVKGWSVARTYAEPALRPYGDIDLCVTDLDAARTALAGDAMLQHNVDLHEGGQHLIDVPFDAVIAASRTVDLDGVKVRIPSPEHHLRILCLHLLYHGAWRPLWLCDIGASMELVGEDFDWAVFLGTDSVRAGWMTSTLRLAESVLGADLSRAPAAVRNATLPGWLERSVLREWSRSHRWTSARTLGASIARRPWAAPFEIVRRWPDPIRASVAFGAPFDRGWRTPYQLRYSLTRFRNVASQLRESSRP